MLLDSKILVFFTHFSFERLATCNIKNTKINVLVQWKCYENVKRRKMSLNTFRLQKYHKG